MHETVTDGVEQVGLAEPYTSVEEERVVATGGILCHGPCGSMGELI